MNINININVDINVYFILQLRKVNLENIKYINF